MIWVSVLRISSTALAVIIFCTLTVAAIVVRVPFAGAILYSEDGMPTGLTGDEFIIVRDTALSDSRVQQLIDGRNYSITDCCGFYRESPTSSWQPVINIRVANELQIGVRVDLSERKVTGIETGPAIQFQVPSDDTVARESTNDNSFTTGVSSRMPVILTLILTISGILVGAAAAVLYFARKRKKERFA